MAVRIHSKEPRPRNVTRIQPAHRRFIEAVREASVVRQVTESLGATTLITAYNAILRREQYLAQKKYATAEATIRSRSSARPRTSRTPPISHAGASTTISATKGARSRPSRRASRP